MSQAILPTSFFDLSRYPVDDLDGAGRSVVERCRRQVAKTGACELEGFLLPGATAQLAAEAAELAHLAHHHEGKSTPYLEIPEAHFPPDHPRQRWDAYSLSALAYDHISPRLSLLYDWNPLMEFVRRALGLPEVYRYADPLGACNVNVFEPGDYLNWHFDHTDFVVSIALQDADEGGDFFYTPKIRSSEAENYDAVSAVLDGNEEQVVRVEMRPGTLLLFQGRYSLHRVSRVGGRALRLVTILSYDTKPGTCATPLLQQARYGRVERPPGETPPA